MYKKISVLAIFLIVLASCSIEDLYIEESVFIPDPEIPGLPIYSEMGYNTFGVRYDRDLITQSNSMYPLKIVVENNATSFIFNGERGWSNNFRLIFKISNYLPSSLEELLNLDQTTFNLDSNNIEIEIDDNNSSVDVEIISGEFEIIKARKLRVDEDDKGVILSGVFQFKAFIDGVPVAFSLGRYDTLIGYSNFFVLN